MKSLLRAGAQLQVKNKRRQSPCVNAAISGSVEMVELFAKNGVDLIQEKKAFRQAAAVGSVAIVQLFLDAGMPAHYYISDDDELRAVDVAAVYGQVAVTRLLLAAGARLNPDVLFSVENIDALKLLIDNDVPVDTRHAYSHATVFGHKACSCVYDSNFLKALLAHGAAVDAQDKNGLSALMCFAHNMNKEGITLAREHGASTALKDRHGRTALDFLADNVRTYVLRKDPEAHQRLRLYPSSYEEIYEELSRPFRVEERYAPKNSVELSESAVTQSLR